MHSRAIISELFKNKYINTNEFEMHGFMEHEVMENWNTNFVDNDTSHCIMHFIS